jgi:flagellum-specific ATP synthase
MPFRQTSRLDVLETVEGFGETVCARPEGCVSQVVGLTIESVGPRVPIGSLVHIDTSESGGRMSIAAEVVGFKDRAVLLTPVEHMNGIRPGAHVVAGGKMRIMAGYGLLGRVVDGMGRVIDDGPPPIDVWPVDFEKPAPHALKRERLEDRFITGIRAIDGLITCAKGQRIGIFAGSGVGKSVLLGSMARESCATVNVIALIGERGREVREFIEKSLKGGMKKSVVVVATADQSPLMRIKGAYTAMAIAEYFRDQGEHVLLMMDSLTRYAMAQREIGLAVGEPPTTKGYPPSVFGNIARLLERSGSASKGTITAFCSVLVEADDMNDPVADTARSVLDGHIVLSRSLAEMNHYPAINIQGSISRLMSEVCDREHLLKAGKVRTLLSIYRKAEDLVNVGAYVAGSNPQIDDALKRIELINDYLKQQPDEASDWGSTLKGLEKILK